MFRVEDFYAFNSEISLREHLDFNKLTTESFDHRDHHVKAIEECGFQRDGVLRQHTKVDGGWVNAILCSRLSIEFQEYQN